MKILYVTTIGSTMGFFNKLVKELLDEGHTVDIATNEETSKVQDYFKEWGCKVYQISTSRSPFSSGNIKAIKQIKSIAGNYDIVHCHTPLAGMATRLACKKLRKKQGLYVIYTAHGFHFFKGAPKKNWLIYYPIERICSKWTDVLITINNEDYLLAKKKFKAKRVEYVAGIGIDMKKFSATNIDRNEKRKSLGIPNDAYLLLSVGELNENKNHQIVIKAIHQLNNSNIHYMIAGVGNQKDSLINLAKDLGVNLHLLGYRKDVPELYKTADLYIHPSFREGLPVSVMEAISSGIDCICSDTRGCRDLVKNDLFSPSDYNALSELISQFKNGRSNHEQNIKDFDQYGIDKVNAKMKSIYQTTQSKK